MGPSGNPLSAFENALRGLQCKLQKRDFDWRFGFGDMATVDVSTPWRLIGRQSLVLASGDNGKIFGRDAPVDVANEARFLLADVKVERAAVDILTADLNIWFDNGLRFQALHNSTGYEAWTAEFRDGDKPRSIVALGGGKLEFF
jgi:hypothetical protein